MFDAQKALAAMFTREKKLWGLSFGASVVSFRVEVLGFLPPGKTAGGGGGWSNLRVCSASTRYVKS